MCLLLILCAGVQHYHVDKVVAKVTLTLHGAPGYVDTFTKSHI